MFIVLHCSSGFELAQHEVEYVDTVCITICGVIFTHVDNGTFRRAENCKNSPKRDAACILSRFDLSTAALDID